MGFVLKARDDPNDLIVHMLTVGRQPACADGRRLRVLSCSWRQRVRIFIRWKWMTLGRSVCSYWDLKGMEGFFEDNHVGVLPGVQRVTYKEYRVV